MEVQTPESGAQRPSPDPGAEAPKIPALVLPHPLKWHQRLAASVTYGLIEAVAFTQRYRFEYHSIALKKETGPFIFCIWHNRLSLSLVLYRQYVRHKDQRHRLAAIVSASKDGGVVARILEHFGAQPVRGSSSRRGPQALLELTTWAERGYDLAITPDGPRGPRYQIQPGALALAQLTGQPLVPVSCHIGWKICLKSWDRFQIPLPFGRIVARFGEPMQIPRETSEEQREALRQQFEQRMKDMTID